MKLKYLLYAFIYLVLGTRLFAEMDWRPIHNSYLKYNDWPHASVYEWWGPWQNFRFIVSNVFCPPCAAFAEHYYFVLFEIEAGIEERNDLLLKHIPEGHKYEGVLSQSGFWWGQGGEDNSNEWKLVSLEAWYLYWGTQTVIWLCGWYLVYWLIHKIKRRIRSEKQ